MPRLIESTDKLYSKYKKMIYKLIHSHARDGHAAFDELESLSNEVFTKCLHKWDPSRGAFSTLLYRSLTNAFRSELKKAETRLRNQGEYLHLSREHEDARATSTDWLLNLLETIDTDAKRVVARLLRLDLEDDIADLSAGKTRELLLETILKEQKDKLLCAFNTIRSSLS